MFSPPQVGQFSISYMSIKGSSLEKPHSEVRVGGLTGIGDEEEDAAVAYGAPGIVFRPRPPEKVTIFDKEGNPTGLKHTVGTDAYATRRADELIPFTWRDVRFNRVFPNPKAGTVALVGYGGGFLSFDDIPPDKDAGTHQGSVGVFYCPYPHSTNVPSSNKAHAIILDGDNGQVSIVHGDGGQINMLPDKEIQIAADASSWIQLKPGEFNVQAEAMSLVGTVSVGDPTAAQAVAMFKQLSAYVEALELHVAAITARLNGPADPLVGAAGALSGTLATEAAAAAALQSSGAATRLKAL